MPDDKNCLSIDLESIKIGAEMQLRYDPYGIFQNSKSPAGLYARQNWLGEFEDPTWKIDFEEVVGALFKSLENSETG